MWYDYALLLFSENFAQERFNVSEIDETFKDTKGNEKKNVTSTKVEDNNDDERTPGGGECIICYENDSNTVIVSCGHQALCETCATTLTFTECPICRTPITGAGIIKVFKC